MMLRKYFVSTVLFLFLVNTNAGSLLPVEDTPKQIHQAVKAYCKVEFEGYWMFNGLLDMMKRQKVVKYSTKRKEELKDDTWNNPFAVNVEVYPIRLVSSYKISDIEVNGSQATAKVVYQYVMLLRDKIDNTHRILADSNSQDSVTFNLVFEDNRWWVFDPPPPKLSKDGLVNYNEEFIHEYGTKSNPKWQKEIDILKSYWKPEGEK